MKFRTQHLLLPLTSGAAFFHRRTGLALCCSLLSLGATAQYSVDWHTVDGGDGTSTEFFNRPRMPIRGWAMMDARTVAEIGYRGMIKGKRVVVPGLMNKLAAILSKRFPPRITAGGVRRVHHQP